jgi:hypothetical protein
MIPNLPTDNLYKFVALSGLVLTGAACYFTYSMSGQLNDKHYQYVSAFVATQEKMKLANSNVEMLNSAIKNTIDAQNGKAVPDGQLAIEIPPKEFKELEIEARRVGSELAIENAMHDIEDQRIQELESELKFVKWAGLFATIVGVAMSSIGFFVWYRKVQKPMDEMIQLQLKEKQGSKPTP